MLTIPRRIFSLLILMFLASLTPLPTSAQDGVYRTSYTSEGRTLTVELLDDDLAHFELSAAPVTDQPIEVTPMIAKNDYPGASAVEELADGSIQTADMHLYIDAASLCVIVTDRTREPDLALTTICPADETTTTSLTMTQNGTTDVYGLGEQFQRRGGADGNWIDRRRTTLSQYGNELVDFNGGAVGNADFPVMYALGSGADSYALFLDNVYHHYWTFNNDPFTVTVSGGALRWYVMTGDDLPDLRSDYMELTGRPPVPPKQMFGLWVSEYGYESWDELTPIIESMRAANFPVDGYILDLFWFGGIVPGSASQMGSLAWDETVFPDPAGFIADLRETDGLGIMVIEEPFVTTSSNGYDEALDAGVLVRSCAEATCDPVTMNEWWGSGSMVDWTNPVASAWWHDNRRAHLIEDGVIGHWTDLGEPEDYSEGSWYNGIDGENHDHASVHNVYNLMWSKSIWYGYLLDQIERRPFIMSRSGTSGSQRYGVAMWSGDIGSNMPSLEAHMNVQMHMSLSGVDYFGSDIGGFHRETGDPLLDDGEMYTVWLANSALIDVPLRAHTSDLQNRFETAPSLVGDVASNLANVRLRYELSPYLYTLAHRAYRDGEAVFAPLVYYYQTDPNVRSLGSQKMIGRDLMMATITGYEELETQSVYLPAGGWFDYYTHKFVESAGEWIEVPVVVDGVTRAPLFVRDGAIIPRMRVDDQTLNMLGMRRDGSADDTLILDVYHALLEGQFTLIEDDGETIAYQDGAVRETLLSAVQGDGGWHVAVNPSTGTYDGASTERTVEINFIGPDGVQTAAESAAVDQEIRVVFEPASGPRPKIQATETPEAAVPRRPLLMAHFMPWYQSPDVSGYWGWHWTMEHFDPTQVDDNGRREVASHYTPLTGFYDSADWDVIEYQVLSMKLAGIDGVIVDWYGIENFRDYAVLNEATLRLFDIVKRAGLRFVLCYEDNTVRFMTDEGYIPEDQAVAHGQEMMQFAQENFFGDPAYLTVDGQPLLFIFGPQYFHDPANWTAIFEGLDITPQIVSLDKHMSFGILAQFMWAPMNLAAGAELLPAVLESYIDTFYRNAQRKDFIVGGAFPSFHDIYEEAGVRSSYGYLDPRDGDTLRLMLAEALTYDTDIIQLITWNDYGEGTMIEPTEETGYQYLEIVQETRRGLTPDFTPTSDDLRLPLQLFNLRRAYAGDTGVNARLDEAFNAIVTGDVAAARAIIESVPLSP